MTHPGVTKARARDIALLRLMAQRIAGPGCATPAEAVHWLTAVQAQDYPGAVTSIALRTRASNRQAVEAAMNAGEIVRSWPMRGTLHFVAAEDLPWLLDVTAGRVLAASATRRAELGIHDDVLEQGRRLAIASLSGGRALSRSELFAIWDEAQLAPAKQRGYHMLSYLALTGTLCFGPVRDGKQQLVLIDEWVRQPRRLERTEALTECALRYFGSHGPATAKDFARWMKLTMTDAKAGITGARPVLEALTVDGVEYLMDPETPTRLDAYGENARGVFLLPGFDEYVLGYADRSAVLAPRFAQWIVPGGNGMFRPTVVSGGQIVGTWKSDGRGSATTVLATPFTSFSRRVRDAIPRVHAAMTN